MKVSMDRSEAEVSVGRLSPLNLLEHPIFKQYLSLSPSWLSAYSVPGLFVWSDFFTYSFTLVDDHLCLFARYEQNYYMPLPPLGKDFSHRAVAESFALMGHLNRHPRVSRIENVDEETAKEIQKMGFPIILQTQEYLYRRESLVDLKGNPYKSKRWAINTFLNKFEASFEPYHPSDFESCMQLFEEWRAIRQARYQEPYYCALMDDARLAHRRALGHFEELNLVCRVVKVDGRVRGYTMGFELHPGVFCILFEVADLRLRGIAQFLFWRFCQELEGYPYINALDASGLDNIRYVKESYRPERLVPSYTVFLDQRGMA